MRGVPKGQARTLGFLVLPSASSRFAHESAGLQCPARLSEGISHEPQFGVMSSQTKTEREREWPSWDHWHPQAVSRPEVSP